MGEEAAWESELAESDEVEIYGQGDDAETAVAMVTESVRSYGAWKAASRSMDVGRGSRYSPTADQKARRGRARWGSVERESG